MRTTTVPESLGHDLFQQGDYAGAVVAYRKALSHRPSAELFHHLGRALGRLEHWEEAKVAYEESLALKPFIAVREQLGSGTEKVGQLFESREGSARLTV